MFANVQKLIQAEVGLQHVITRNILTKIREKERKTDVMQIQLQEQIFLEIIALTVKSSSFNN